MVRFALWIFYLLFYTSIASVSYFTEHPNKGIFDYIDMPVTFVAWLGMVIYIFKVKQFYCKFWKFYGPLFIMWEVVYNVIITGMLKSGQKWNAESYSTLDMTFALVFVIPLFAALLGLRKLEKTE